MTNNTLTPQQVYIYGSLGISLFIFIVANTIIIMKLKINTVAFMGQIKKLLLADNIDRAIKLTSIVPSAMIPAGVYTLLTTFKHGTSEKYMLEETSKTVLDKGTKLLSSFKMFSYIGLLFLIISVSVAVYNSFHIPNYYILAFISFSLFNYLRILIDRLKKDLSQELKSLVNLLSQLATGTQESTVENENNIDGEKIIDNFIEEVTDPGNAIHEDLTKSVFCTFCNIKVAPMPDIPGVEISNYNINDYVKVECPKCGGTFFEIK